MPLDALWISKNTIYGASDNIDGGTGCNLYLFRGNFVSTFKERSENSNTEFILSQRFLAKRYYKIAVYTRRKNDAENNCPNH